MKYVINLPDAGKQGDTGADPPRVLAQDRCYMDPKKFAHMRAELGAEALDPTKRSGSAA